MRADARPIAATRGLVLLAVLALLVLAGLVALVGAQVWATTLQREREAELLFVGDQYRRAIDSYWHASPAPVKTLPTSIEQLLADDRFPRPVRHLRRAYVDPVTGRPFALIKLGNGIVGVHSTDRSAPLKRSGFPPRYLDFEQAAGYDQWRFVFAAPRRPGAGTPTAASPRNNTP